MAEKTFKKAKTLVIRLDNKYNKIVSSFLHNVHHYISLSV